MRAGFVLLAMCCMSEDTRCSCASLGMLDGRRVVWRCLILPCIKSLLPFCLRLPRLALCRSLDLIALPHLHDVLLTAGFALQFAPKNLLASSAEHLPIFPSRHSSPRTPRPERTNIVQMGGFLHSQCRPGALANSRFLIDKRPLTHTRACL